jgi:predicted nucleic acid-binding protein
MNLLLDTNVLLRSFEPASPHYATIQQAVAKLLADGATLFITAQNLIEFWAVATRLTAANGYG